MSKRKWSAAAVLAVTGCVVAALGQYTIPDAPRVPQFVPPPVPQMGVQSVEDIGVTELRIGLQKAQIQAGLADRVAQVKEDAAKGLEAAMAAAGADQEALLNAQVDVIGARAAADTAKLDVTSMDVQNLAGPAALQQAEAMQQRGGQASPLVTQLMQMDLKKAQIQATAAAQLVPLKQKIYDLMVAQRNVGRATASKVSDALLDLEAAKAGQQTSALDEQLMNARLAAAGIKR